MKNSIKIMQSEESDYFLNTLTQQKNGNRFNNKALKDHLNIKLGYNTMLTVHTPGGTTTTIMPMSNKNVPSYKDAYQGLEFNLKGKEKNEIDKGFRSQEGTTRAINHKMIKIKDMENENYQLN